MKKAHNESITREKQIQEMLQLSEKNESELNKKLQENEERLIKEQRALQKELGETEKQAKENRELTISLKKELLTKQRILSSFQDELNSCTERLTRSRQENERLYKKIQELDGKSSFRTKRIDSLTDLTNIDLEIDLDNLTQNELVEQCIDLRSRFEKAIIEIRAVKRELRDSHIKYDSLELENVGFKRNLEIMEEDAQSHAILMANRVQDLTNKLAVAERQARSLKAKLQDSREKRRSLSLKGRENFSINKEVEDKVNELEAKILSLERGRTKRKHRRERSGDRTSPIDDRSPRRPRRKSLDSATTSEPMKLLMRLSSLETKVCNVNTSNESLNTLITTNSDFKLDDSLIRPIYLACESKLKECLECANLLKSNKNRHSSCSSSSPSRDIINNLEELLNEFSELFLNLRGCSSVSVTETNAINTSAGIVIKHLIVLLNDKLLSINERKRMLREQNNLNERTTLELLAEKIAYENIIIGRIKDALETTPTGETTCDRFMYKEIIETSNLINNLHNKLKGNTKKEPTICKTSVEYLTKVLTNRLVLSAKDNTRLKTSNFSPFIKQLKEEQTKLNASLESYKAKKMTQLAEALANEALSLSADSTCRLRQSTVNDAWKTARETVNSELIQSEINHILLRAAQIYEANSSLDQNFFFSFFASERAALELWSDSVENYLRIEMDKNIEELTDLFKTNLNKLQRQNWRRRVESERSSKSTNILLTEFADIVAHKVLIDARISVLNNEYTHEEKITLDNQGKRIKELLKQDIFWYDIKEIGLADINLNLEAEFKSMFEFHQDECVDKIVFPQINLIRDSICNVTEEISELERLVNKDYKIIRLELNNLSDISKACQLLQNKLFDIRKALLNDGNLRKR